VYYCCGCGDEDASNSAWYTLLLGGGGYYFVPLVIAYAVGLLMANAAVYLMQMGQPALLYLVPCTLGTMIYLGWKREELRALWEGPKVIATADEIVFGRRPASTTRETEGTSETVSDGDGNVPESEGAEYVDDETGDVPLLSTNTNASSNGDDSNDAPAS
jgi:signal peptide peptidase-like protein 2B